MDVSPAPPPRASLRGACGLRGPRGWASPLPHLQEPGTTAPRRRLPKALSPPHGPCPPQAMASCPGLLGSCWVADCRGGLEIFFRGASHPGWGLCPDCRMRRSGSFLPNPRVTRDPRPTSGVPSTCPAPPPRVSIHPVPAGSPGCPRPPPGRLPLGPEPRGRASGARPPAPPAQASPLAAGLGAPLLPPLPAAGAPPLSAFPG